MEAISCTISPLRPIYLSGTTKSGCAIIDVVIPNNSGIKISEVQFKNNYTASICIKGKSFGGDDFRTILKHYQLMKSPHYANDSQNVYKINLIENGCAVETLTSLRFILHQPSSLWQRFSIEDIKVYKALENITIVEKEKENDEGVKDCDPSISDIIQGLEKLVGQMERVKNHHSEFDPLPFDVDGCYDINLLSYT